MNSVMTNIIPIGILALAIVVAFIILRKLFVMPKQYDEDQKVRLELIKRRQRAEEIERMTIGDDDEEI